ncbi:Winged helix-turn-helix [uncultured archaeon]|nr:Winged helix-turn-helix [uncultured archaeon]
MRSNVGSMLTEIKDMSRGEAIAVGVGGLLIGSTITHGEMIYTMSSIITKAFEIGIGMWQNNITIDPNAGKLIVASASPGTILIYQKNKESGGMRKERSRFEIIEDMLAVLTEEKSVKKTRIMQRAYLNWRGLQKYFDFLIEESFIVESNNPGTGSYAITEKGKELLKRLKNVKEILR